MKQLAKKFAARFGYDIRKRGTDLDGRVLLRLYDSVCRVLLGRVERAAIAQVGANDGKINDPLYGLIRAHAERTRVLHIEPQAALVPVIRENFAFHPAHDVHQGAVGAPGRLTLHAVAERVWPKLVVPYAAGWPAYRAPTGVTSSNRAQVEAWVAAHLPDPAAREGAVEAFEVASQPLDAILATVWEDVALDILQVDVEGADDTVLYHAALERTAPAIVCFESKFLDAGRMARLTAHLEGLGYAVFRSPENSIALKG